MSDGSVATFVESPGAWRKNGRIGRPWRRDLGCTRYLGITPKEEPLSAQSTDARVRPMHGVRRRLVLQCLDRLSRLPRSHWTRVAELACRNRVAARDQLVKRIRRERMR